MCRIFDAIDDLSRAMVGTPPQPEAGTLLRWLIDRLAPKSEFVVQMAIWAAPDSPLGRALPDLQQRLDRLDKAVTQGARREYDKAIAGLRQLKQEFLQDGWPVCACHCDLYLADSLLRRFELQSALDHLDRAESLTQLICSPASSVLQEQAERQRSDSLRQSGLAAHIIEQEYRELYGLFLSGLSDYTAMMRLDVLGRMGAFDEFFALLGRHPEYESAPAADSLQGHINLAARLRDGGQAGRALVLTDKLIPLAESGTHKMALANLRASVLQVLGREDEAVAAYTAAIEDSRRLDVRGVRLLAANLARLLLDRGEAEQARGLIARELASPAGLSPMDRIVWHWTRAELAQADKRPAEAGREVQVALLLAESVRTQIRGAEPRRIWFTRISALFDLAITVALEQGRVALALTLVERTRARATVDLLATGMRAVPAAAAELVAARDALHERRKMLRQLDEGMQRLGVGFVDVAQLAALQALDPALELTQTSAAGRLMMSPARLDQELSDANGAISRLDDRIEDLTEAAHADALGEVLDAAAIGALLDD
jgi:tetratricopeptide (TPR) repeat protein